MIYKFFSCSPVQLFITRSQFLMYEQRFRSKTQRKFVKLDLFYAIYSTNKNSGMQTDRQNLNCQIVRILIIEKIKSFKRRGKKERKGNENPKNVQRFNEHLDVTL